MKVKNNEKHNIYKLLFFIPLYKKQMTIVTYQNSYQYNIIKQNIYIN